jgi:hypothetical protein
VYCLQIIFNYWQDSILYHFLFHDSKQQVQINNPQTLAYRVASLAIKVLSLLLFKRKRMSLQGFYTKYHFSRSSRPRSVEHRLKHACMSSSLVIEMAINPLGHCEPNGIIVHIRPEEHRERCMTLNGPFA